MFNSSRRSLVLVKQFRPGETSWLGRGWEGGITLCFQALDPERLKAEAVVALGETEAPQEVLGPE